MAPGLGLYKIIMISEALGIDLPLGVCPHDHACRWQRPAGPKPRRLTYQEWAALHPADPSSGRPVPDPAAYARFLGEQMAGDR